MSHDLTTRRLWWIAAAAALGALLPVRPAAAQQQDDPWNFHSPDVTRQQLVQLLARYQAAGQSPVYSAGLRASTAVAVDSIRSRLRDGDIRAGDRLRLTVSDQKELSDTFAITAGPALILPVVGTLSLAGVLRSELQDRITTSVDSVYRDAVVQVVLLTRVAVTDGVVRPGYYALPPDALIADAITAAGGLLPYAKLSHAYVERGNQQVWQADSLQAAMRTGRTLGQLGLQAGDRIVVPLGQATDPVRQAQLISQLVGLPVSIYAIVQLFKVL